MIPRSKERSFILILISMGTVGVVMWLDAGLSGGSRSYPLVGYTVLALQASVLLWLVRAEDHNVAATVGEVAAAAPFAAMLIWAKVH
jgi:hypothetical protein